MKPDTTIKAYFAAIGATGGSNGKGSAKKRSTAHYRRAAQARWAKVKAAKP